MKTDIWMPIYIGDYLADTMHLTTEQHGAYFLLIMTYWRKGKALPACDKKLSQITKMDMDAWSIAKADLKDFFDTDSDPQLWIHHRIEKELKLAQERREKHTQRAKKAAAARWGK